VIKVKAVLFDLDDTLIDHKGAVRAALNNLFFEHQELATTFHDVADFRSCWNDSHKEFYNLFLKNKLTADEQRIKKVQAVWAKACIHLDTQSALRISDRFLKYYEESWAIFPETLPLLISLKYLTIGIITNGESAQQRRKLEKLGILSFIKSVTISSDVGISKPDPEIFLHACRELKVDPSEACFVGDIFEVDIVGAKNAKMNAVLYDPEKQFDEIYPNLKKVNSLLELKQLFTQADFQTQKLEYIKLKDLLKEADQDKELTGFVYPEDETRERIAIIYQDKVVGFFTPRQDLDGIWRMGAVYVSPLYRCLGLASNAIKEFMLGRKGRAFIENHNLSSTMAFLNAGFSKAKEVPEKDGAWYANF